MTYLRHVRDSEGCTACVSAVEAPGGCSPRASPRASPRGIAGSSVAAIARRLMQRAQPVPPPVPQRPTVRGEAVDWSFPAILSAFREIEDWDQRMRER